MATCDGEGDGGGLPAQTQETEREMWIDRINVPKLRFIRVDRSNKRALITFYMLTSNCMLPRLRKNKIQIIN